MKKDIAYPGKDIESFVLYLTFFILTLVLVLGIWYFFVDGVFYYCSDKLPFFDLFPPFVHGENGPDHFIASPIIVYAFWVSAMSLIFILPGIILKRILKLNAFKIVKMSLSVPILLTLLVLLVYLLTILSEKLFL